MEDKITLELTINEVNGVLVALSKLPYEHVANLVEKVQNQAAPQAAAILEANAPTKESEDS